MRAPCHVRAWRLAVFILLWIFVFAIPAQPVRAQLDTGKSQQLSGRIKPDGVVYYDLPALQRSETLYVLMHATSDDLDPFIGLLPADIDLDATRAGFGRDMNAARANANPVAAIDAVRDKYFLAWDDDSGPGFAAALTYTIPRSGDYYLVVSSSVTTLWRAAFGDYELYVGIDEPAVLDGETDDTAVIAIQNDALSPAVVAVQSITGMLSESKSAYVFGIIDVNAGDTFYLLAEPLSAELDPTMILLNFGGKPVAMVVSESGDDRIVLEHTFREDGGGYRLVVQGCCGAFRLSAGLNVPEVLSGHIETRGGSVLETAIPVDVGIRLQEITDIDQAAENFSVVATLNMDWYDPRLAFNPEECECLRKVFTQRNFGSFAEEMGDNWPDFTFFNQQGNRWIQNQTAVILPDGSTTYLERFTTTFQAPDFDFEQFPFDSQQFSIVIDGLWSEDLYVFQDDPEFTAVGTQLGEEEWYITDVVVNISSVESNTQLLTPRYTFRFQASRNLSFYMLRIFVPILVVIVVSWITFFLRDYDKRVDVATGNLLLFIAFNFTISDDLPRLGYLTFMDVVLISTFLITALVVVFTVFLKRLENAERDALAKRLDLPMIWLYPLLYVGILGAAYYLYFIEHS